MNERVGFTPTKDELYEIQRSLLNSCPVSVTCSSFPGVNSNESTLPQGKEIKIIISGICVSEEEYAIRGLIIVDGAQIGKGKLVVDLTVEPPVAHVKDIEE